MSGLVISTSGRMLAEAAHQAHDPVYVIDVFADQDTRRAAKGVIAIDNPNGSLHFSLDNLDIAIDQLRQMVLDRGDAIDRLILGTGFEDQPRLIDQIVARVTKAFGTVLFNGNSSLVVALAKEPSYLANLMRRAGLQHPQLRLGTPGQKLKDSGQWLIKRQGAYGGDHIRWSPSSNPKLAANEYEQEFIAGTQFAVVFAAQLIKGRIESEILGLSKNWSDGTEASPFRWGGVAGSLILPDSLMESLHQATTEIARSLNLNGINGLDSIIGQQTVFGIEINPRPSASFELFSDANFNLWQSFFAPNAPPLQPGFARMKTRLSNSRHLSLARAIVYADCDLMIPDGFNWADDCGDIPQAGLIRQGFPVCSVLVKGVEIDNAILRAKSRVAALKQEFAQEFLLSRVSNLVQA
ncbi:MAG: ATP-grasp domain-containing protein [Candidatus Pacebacteria bacterium]|nr:ATP-grasp domain-containing protein [Candidatus Paceibacterota bacterium]